MDTGTAFPRNVNGLLATYKWNGSQLRFIEPAKPAKPV